MKKYKKTKIFLITIVAIVLIIWGLGLAAGRVKKIDYGVTYSVPYAQALGLDWKKTYDDMLKSQSQGGLNIKLVRVPVFWDEVEAKKGTYDFSDIDYMVKDAADHNAKVILAVGKRLPRWPECHQPDWSQKLSATDQNDELMSYIETAVRRYYSDAAVTTWQVENEPFLSSFGPCQKLDVAFYDKELAFVKQLDPSRPILVTDSGELSNWLSAGSRGDEFGSTYYRYVYSDVLHRYWTNFYFPAWFYRLKGGIVRLLYGNKPIMIAELEAEPWTTAGITNTSFADQFKTMSLSNFNTITSLASKTGFSPQILWGVEWWDYMRQHGHPEFWVRAGQLINQ